MTAALIMGTIAFGCAFASDYISALHKHRGGGTMFCISVLLLSVSTIILIITSDAAAAFRGNTAFFHWIFLVFSVISLLMLFVSVFFVLLRGGSSSLPPRDDRKRPLVDSGLYALCRHPGVLFFCLFYFFSAISFGGTGLWTAFVMYSVFDIIYALWQDRFVFPDTISDYQMYRRTVPFLIPTWKSIKKCLSDIRRRY
jgi:protein-S-isoprenylcysteine O-methyltransferase Ste14